MWGHASKAWAAWSLGLATVLGDVVSASLVHGRVATYAVLAISALGALAGVPAAVYKVINTPTAGRPAALVAAAPELIADARKVEAAFKDLHAGVAVNAPWPSVVPPVP